ncbi:MAG: metal-dependent transcriptional regulator [Lachnospiraceae bacterium]|nr:metal-dependent transcriptional regulator [Lachnospiraceae bacterium]
MRESGEMYLETILVLSKEKATVRSIDVADYRNFSKPSVSRAVNRLKDDGYINISPEGFLTLTKKGLEVANTIYERHIVLTKILCKLGVEETIAADDACRIEHCISAETFDALKKYVAGHIDGK